MVVSVLSTTLLFNAEGDLRDGSCFLFLSLLGKAKTLTESPQQASTLVSLELRPRTTPASREVTNEYSKFSSLCTGMEGTK